MAARSSDKPFKLLQITDTHLYGVPEGTLLKMNTHESFVRVLGAIRQENSDIDLVLATGDIAQDGSVAAYQFFIDYIKQLDTPVRWIPGNHDIRDTMEDLSRNNDFGRKVEKVGNWQIILLDSSRTNHVHGFLGSREMEFLEDSLKDAETDSTIEHCLVTLHHNPVPGSSGWMKDIGLRNDREFFEVIRSHEIVRSVIYGHIHQELDFKIGNIRFFCTPSTCIQFKPEVIDFSLDEVNPGYRLLELYADGSIESNVVRVEGIEFSADLASAGY